MQSMPPAGAEVRLSFAIETIETPARPLEPHPAVEGTHARAGIGDASGTFGGESAGVFEFLIVFTQAVGAIRAAADVAKVIKWFADKGTDVRVDESGIDILARGELERRGHNRYERVSIVRTPARDGYLATYELKDGRLAILRYALDSILLGYEETEPTVIEDSTDRGFDPTAYR